MLRWYDIILLQIIVGVICTGINKVYTFIPLKTDNSWVIYGIIITIFSLAWWLYLSPLIGLEYTSAQWQHILLAALIQIPMSRFIFKPLFING